MSAATTVRALGLALAVAGLGRGGAFALPPRAAGWLSAADPLVARVAAERGLSVRRPIRRELLSRPAARAHLRERLLAESDPGEALALARLGFFAPGADPAALVGAALGGSVGGFYDPRRQTLYVVEGASAASDSLLAHELVHALQDQHVGLEAFLLGSAGNSDAARARQALVEGDASAAALEHAMASEGRAPPWANEGIGASLAAAVAAENPPAGDLPLAIRDALLFPYSEGLRFVAHLRRFAPWSAVDEAYRKPPLSTEHILHPESYDAYERPVELGEVVPAALRGFRPRHGDVIGERGFAVFLRQHGVAQERAEVAAAGWGGDRYLLATPPGHREGLAGSVGLSLSVWDADADAMEFFAALTLALPRLGEGPALPRAGGDIEVRLADGSAAAARRRGDAVALVIGAPPARVEELLGAILGWPRVPVQPVAPP